MQVTNVPALRTSHRITLGSHITEKGLDNLTKVIMDDLFFGPGSDYIELPGIKDSSSVSKTKGSFVARAFRSLLTSKKPEVEKPSQTIDNFSSVTVPVTGTTNPLEVVNGRPTIKSLKPYLQEIYQKYVGKLVDSVKGGSTFAELVAEIDQKLFDVFQAAGMVNTKKYEYTTRRDKSHPYDRDNVLNPIYRPYYKAAFDYDANNGYFLTGQAATQFTLQSRGGQIVIPEKYADDGTPIIAPTTEYTTEESRTSCLTDIVQQSKPLDIDAR